VTWERSSAEFRQTLGDYQMLFSDIVAVDAAVAIAAFEIGGRTPQRLPLVDALIAATAQSRGACLMHRDRHMTGIPAEIVCQLPLAATQDSPE
jgi:predicted nucleic acid-binding protein